MESHRTWPAPYPGPRFSALSFPNPRASPHSRETHKKKKRSSAFSHPIPTAQRSPAAAAGFEDLPADLLAGIAAAFDVPDLWAVSAVCRPWRDALRPLREAMVLLRWGKRFKHGSAGVRPDPQRALESFLKGAARGSAAAMTDAGLMYWEMGRKEEGKALYRKAAMLGYPAAQCNLGICYLEGDKPELEEAVKWFCQAAKAGYLRAQYNLALCLQRGRGVKCNLPHAVKWYLKAAEGGNARAMYNLSLCYSSGEGVTRNNQRARTWMKCAADCGHRKAQFEHGLELFASGDMTNALIYLELATRAGETSASHIKSVILQSLPRASRDRAMLSADRWRPVQFHR